MALRHYLGTKEDLLASAARLPALVDGLRVHGLLRRMDEAAMLAVLNAHLDGILRGPAGPDAKP